MPSEQTLKQIQSDFQAAENKTAFVAELREWVSKTLSITSTQPVDLIRWIPIEKVTANDYNPNSVAKNEMRLLYVSILHDGYTQPVVTIYDKDSDKYVIVDGFHRYTTMRLNQDIRDRCGGLLPVVVIDKPINDRMASTIRHNRARGKHSVNGMSNMVFQMLENGWSDEDICKEIGCEPDELIRLKHVTGFSKLFENVEYRRAWESKKQIQLREKWKEQNEGRENANRSDQAVLEEPEDQSGDD
jgi:ParB-like chromosome segregation protein Spo0J